MIHGESRAIASAGGRREHRRSELDELFNHGGKLAANLVTDQILALNRDTGSRYTNGRVRKPSP